MGKYWGFSFSVAQNWPKEGIAIKKKKKKKIAKRVWLSANKNFHAKIYLVLELMMFGSFWWYCLTWNNTPSWDVGNGKGNSCPRSWVEIMSLCFAWVNHISKLSISYEVDLAWEWSLLKCSKKWMCVIWSNGSFDETWYISLFPFDLRTQPRGKKCF